MYCRVCTSKIFGGNKCWRDLCVHCSNVLAKNKNYIPGGHLPDAAYLLMPMYEHARMVERNYYARKINVTQSLNGEINLTACKRVSPEEKHAMWVVSYVCDVMGWERDVCSAVQPLIHGEVLKGRNTLHTLSEALEDENLPELPELPELPDLPSEDVNGGQ